MNRVRLYISSPVDVAEERRRAIAVVERLREEFRELTLDVLSREQEAPDCAADSTALTDLPDDFDVYTTIIGGRLGGPTGPHADSASNPLHGSITESEFEAAVTSYRDRGKPELLVYRKSLSQSELASHDSAGVAQFFDKWFLSSKDRTAIGAYHTFSESEQFEDLFAVHLRKLLRRFLPRPNNLPAPTSSFVGRVDLIREVNGLLRQSDVRMVALVGPGGTGKSRLGLRVAREQLPYFEDGVFLITLASCVSSCLSFSLLFSLFFCFT